MADIKSYLKEKEKRDQNQIDYKDKIRRHRMGTFCKIMMVLIALSALAVLVVVQYRKHIYTGYEIVQSAVWESASGARDIHLGNTVLTYSRDGAHCTDFKGNPVWNQTYGMQELLISTNRNVAAISDYNGHDVYIVNDQKLLGSFSTNLPIKNIAVSASGKAAVVMADSKISYFNVYNSEGEAEFEGKATMSKSGYPMALAFSPNGVLLQVAYIYLDAGVQKTNVAFYNLGAVGDNKNENLVSAYTYTDVIVPQVQFMNDDTAFAVGDNQLIMYKGAQVPMFEAVFAYSDEVHSVYYSEKYIGLLFFSDNEQGRYRLQVYDSNAKPVGNYYFDLDCTDLFFEKESFTVYNDAECLIMTYSGIEKFNGRFEKAVRRMIPTGSSYKYVIVTNDTIDTIQLK